ncbi:TPA: sialate O-acetylesterase [Serratia marcescens]
MLGDSVRPKSRTAAEFVPVGQSVLNPLKSVVQSSDGSAILTDEQVAALPPGAGNDGESGTAQANFLRKLWLQKNCLERDQSRRFVISSTGVGGQTIEELSKGASPELYQRPLQAVSRVKAIADQLGISYSMAAIIWIQGEYNYSGTRGGVQTKDEYKTLLTKLYSDMVSDMAVGIAGKTSPPAIFMYQTGGVSSSDNYDLAIGMAQWEFCKENTNAYLATPAYPYPDKGVHLTSNSYRWMDMQFAKVMHRVLNEGQGWEPLGPIRIVRVGRVVYVLYHVPSPPLQFRPSYVGRVPTMYADKGFRITDVSGNALPIESVEIAADTIIKITLAEPPTGEAKLWYGDKTAHNGNGNVFDSDNFASLANYEYQAGSGQYADENIPELVGKPYPLNNPSVQFCIKIEIGE